MKEELESLICAKIQDICKQKLKYQLKIDVEALVVVTVDDNNVITLKIDSLRSSRQQSCPPGEQVPNNQEQFRRVPRRSSSTENQQNQVSKENEPQYLKKLLLAEKQNGEKEDGGKDTSQSSLRSSAERGEFRHPSEIDCSNVDVQVKPEPIDNDEDQLNGTLVSSSYSFSLFFVVDKMCSFFHGVLK